MAMISSGAEAQNTEPTFVAQSSEVGYTVISLFDQQTKHIKEKMLAKNTFQLGHNRTGDQSLIREINLSVIMKALQKNAPISRASLAELTGLNKSTVSSLVKELIEYRLVREVGLSTAAIGRPSRLLEINPDAGYIVSGEIGVGFISVMVTNSAAEVLWLHTINLDAGLDQQAILDQVLALLHQGVTQGQSACAACDTLLGVAMSVPGLVDQDTGNILLAPNMDWHDIPLYSVLQDAFPNTPIFVDNEANVAALGEYYFGVARDYSEILYLSVGVGLGGAMVINGRVFRGRTGMAGEFGHMTMQADGKLCSCGNRGCWETLVSQQALFDYIQQHADNEQSTPLRNLVGGDWQDLTIPMVHLAAQQGDQLARDAFAEMGRCLGIGAASLVNALNPDLVLLGGMMSRAGEYILPTLRDEMSARAMHWNEAATDVVLAQYGSDASMMGGVAKVFQAILTNPGQTIRTSA